MINQRKEFEQWYACNAFNYERDPIGSRDCGLQWDAWQAAIAQKEAQQEPVSQAALQAQPAAEPVATMWREKNTKLYPGIVFRLTDTGNALPLGVRHTLFATPQPAPDVQEALRLALEALALSRAYAETVSPTPHEWQDVSIHCQLAIAAIEKLGVK
jgi:hypothetical protein